MSIDYIITDLFNIKDENITFLYGIYHKLVKGVKYTVLNAKASYYNEPCPHCGCDYNSIITKYGFKSSTVSLSKANLALYFFEICFKLNMPILTS